MISKQTFIYSGTDLDWTRFKKVPRMTTEEIFEQLKNVLVKNFELNPEDITLDANIATDLDLDSIDAIDILSSIQRVLNCRLTPSDFKTVKTVRDIVEVIQKHVP